ncbi:MAG: multidrug efflux SMR transporter [Bacteriovorax sp.]|nr:multidrug efflux SMR transporter [Bacteriovorax sp.]
MSPWLILFFAICSEVVGTTAMKLSNGFTKVVPIVFVLLGYGSALILLAKSMKDIPLGTAYAVWAGFGTVCAALIGKFLFQEHFGLAQFLGMFLVISGIVILHLYQTH